jgi:hypothetical protein
MAGIGNLDKIFMNPGKLSDYSWLDIDIKDYDNVPFFDPIPEYMAVPKLETQWKHLNENTFNLIPNSDFDFNYKTPQDNNIQDIPLLIDSIKKQMMSGKNGKDLVSSLQGKVSLEVLKLAKDELSKLAKEQGLLGVVYIDPTVFKKCADGASFLEKRAKTAKYVKSMSKCAGCTFNKQGRCEVYKKLLAKEIAYNSELFSFYSKHFSNILGKEVNIDSVESIKKAALFKEKEEVKYAQNKPVDKSKEKSLKDKEKEYTEQLKDLKDSLSELKNIKLTKDLSMLLIKGYSQSNITDYISRKYSKEEILSNKDIFKNILDKQGSLGKIYLEASYLPYKNCFEARELLATLNPSVSYLIADTKKTFCKCKEGVGHKCSNLNKTVIASISDIPKQAWELEFYKNPEKITNKISNIFKQYPQKGIKLAFMQHQLETGKIKIEKVADYGLKSQIDHTEYTPSVTKTATLSLSKLITALNKGTKLSQIYSFLKNKLGFESSKILNLLNDALLKVSSVHRYQLDMDLPNVKKAEIIISQKDMNISLSSPILDYPDFAKNSAESPIDNLVYSLGLENPDFTIEDNKKSETIEISGLNEFNIE